MIGRPVTPLPFRGGEKTWPISVSFRIVGFSRIPIGSSKKNGTLRLFQYVARVMSINTSAAIHPRFEERPTDWGEGGMGLNIRSLHTRTEAPESPKCDHPIHRTDAAEVFSLRES